MAVALSIVIAVVAICAEAVRVHANAMLLGDSGVAADTSPNSAQDLPRKNDRHQQVEAGTLSKDWGARRRAIATGAICRYSGDGGYPWTVFDRTAKRVSG